MSAHVRRAFNRKAKQVQNRMLRERNALNYAKRFSNETALRSDEATLAKLDEESDDEYKYEPEENDYLGKRGYLGRDERKSSRDRAANVRTAQESTFEKEDIVEPMDDSDGVRHSESNNRSDSKPVSQATKSKFYDSFVLNGSLTIISVPTGVVKPSVRAAAAVKNTKGEFQD